MRPALSRFHLRRFSRLIVGFVLIAASLAATPTRADEAGVVDWQKYLTDADRAAAGDWRQLGTPKADKVVVYKARRILELLRGDAVIKTYHVALGHNPDGPKVREGDGRTPEGSYRIDRRKLLSDYHLALHISYPDVHDIKRAAALGVSPGGGIMIHGQPGGMTPAEKKKMSTDWTAGCIALTNPEIDEVWRLVDDGTTVDIYP
jgi:murein L,D-transpeptidase YafK